MQPFKLSEALKSGPVVLFFYPKAFTSGCTLEAHLFAEATPRFAALNTKVLGVSHDDLETLKRFSLEECRSQFAVAADTKASTIKAYDVGFLLKPDMADRVTYLIGQDRKVIFVYGSLDPKDHVEMTLKALTKSREPNRPEQAQ